MVYTELIQFTLNPEYAKIDLEIEEEGEYFLIVNDERNKISEYNIKKLADAINNIFEDKYECQLCYSVQLKSKMLDHLIEKHSANKLRTVFNSLIKRKTDSTLKYLGKLKIKSEAYLQGKLNGLSRFVSIKPREEN